MKRVKLLDTNLIRTFGGVIVEMDDGQAERYSNNGQAKIIESIHDPYKNNADGELINDKTVWSPPEDTLFISNEQPLNDIYPKPEDKLFAQIN